MKRREMTLDEIRSVQFEILEKIHGFCKERGLRYSLGGGTLLGAVRHKGYIPWDDDIDIMLPRPDYENLRECFNDVYPNLVLQDYHTDASYPLRWLRIYDNRTVLISNNSISGVFVDVFPIDGLPGEEEIDSYLKQSRKLKRQLGWATKFHQEAVKKNLFVLTIKYYVKRLVFPNRKVVIKRIDDFFWGYPFETSEYAGAIVGMFGRKEIMKSEIFKSFTELEFEGKRFMCIKEYDAYLKKHYGDYMKLPPENERKSHHPFKVYWKD